MAGRETSPEGDPAAPRPGVVDKFTRVLDVFVLGPDRMLLDDVAAAAGIARSTTFRLLCQLVEAEWLEHDRHGYRLGRRAHGLGRRVESHLPLRAAATAALYDLHVATAGVVHLAVLDGGTIEMIDKVGGRPTPTIPTTVGTRYPAEDAVVGRAMLARLAPEQVDRVLGESGRSAADGGLGRLHDRLGTIRSRRGLAITTDDMPWDLRGVGAAIIGPHGPVGAISVGLPGRSAPVERFAPALARAVRATSQRLFGASGGLAAASRS